MAIEVKITGRDVDTQMRDRADELGLLSPPGSGYTSTMWECPSCDSLNVRRIGPLATLGEFAGHSIDADRSDASLFECKSCSIAFRGPQPTPHELAVLYTVGDSSAWSEPADAERKDWSWTLSKISHIRPATVIDIGCFDGAFLAQVGADVQLFGVEISSAAVEAAKSKGVTVIADDASRLTDVSIEFDVVCAFDVIEHVPNPSAFIRNLADITKPGGSVFISTGNFHTPARRFMRSRYWYCEFPEHISFVSPRWFEGQIDALSLTVVDTIKFSRGSKALGTRLSEATRNILFRLAEKRVIQYRDCKRPGGSRSTNRTISPSWRSATDHFIIQLEKT